MKTTTKRYGLFVVWIAFIDRLQHVDLQLGGVSVLVDVSNYLQRDSLPGSEQAKLSSHTFSSFNADDYCHFFLSKCLVADREIAGIYSLKYSELGVIERNNRFYATGLDSDCSSFLLDFYSSALSNCDHVQS